MGNEKTNQKDLAWMCYLDEDNKRREGFFEIIKFDASFVKFKTNKNNIITLPTIRILKLKERDCVEDGDRIE